jgi:hypothetical protein
MARVLALLLLAFGAAVVPAAVRGQAPAPPEGRPAPPEGRPAPPEVVGELRRAVEQARQRFEARDAGALLATVSEQYRSEGVTKPALRQQILGIYALYDVLRARVAVDQVELVEGTAWVYTTGDVSGVLPVLGRVTVLAWERQPEVARREGVAWKLFGFQD